MILRGLLVAFMAMVAVGGSALVSPTPANAAYEARTCVSDCKYARVVTDWDVIDSTRKVIHVEMQGGTADECYADPSGIDRWRRSYMYVAKAGTSTWYYSKNTSSYQSNCWNGPNYALHHSTNVSKTHDLKTKTVYYHQDYASSAFSFPSCLTTEIESSGYDVKQATC